MLDVQSVLPCKMPQCVVFAMERKNLLAVGNRARLPLLLDQLCMYRALVAMKVCSKAEDQRAVVSTKASWHSTREALFVD